jgi:YVTN family beta-propeller protein
MRAYALGLGAAVLLTTACGLNQEGVPPPRDRIVYPSSARLDGNGRWLYVANSNSDLRYNNGTLVAVDLARAAEDLDPKTHAWGVCPKPDFVRSYSVALDAADGQGVERCCWDALDHNVLLCDERPYVHAESTIEIGSFAAGMTFQHTAPEACAATVASRHDCSRPCPQGVDGGADAGASDAGAGDAGAGEAGAPRGVEEGRLFIGVRGNSSITYIKATTAADGAPRLSCGDSTLDSKACSVSQTPEAPNTTPRTVPDEPYALYLDDAADLLYVGHLRGDTAHAETGGVSLFDVARPLTSAPAFLRASRSLFGADQSGFFGITSLGPMFPEEQDPAKKGPIFATSRYLPLVAQVGISLDAGDLCGQDPSTIFVSPSAVPFASPLVGAEMRGIQFTSPTRAFALQRIPPALIGFEITNGRLGNVATDIVETCAAPTFLQKAGTGAALRLYVTCFESGQVYVVDPSVPQVSAVIDVGRGPAGLVFSSQTGAPARAYVVGFGHNNVSVVDLEPGSRTQYHVIQKLGFPSVLPR